MGRRVLSRTTGPFLVTRRSKAAALVCSLALVAGACGGDGGGGGGVATGGGSRVADDSPVMVEFDAPTADGRGWEARAEHMDEDDDSASVTVTAVCAKGYSVAQSQGAAR